MATDAQAIEFLKSIGWYQTRFVFLRGLEANEDDAMVGEMIYEMDALTLIQHHLEERDLWTRAGYDDYPLDFEDGDDLHRAIDQDEEKWEEHCKTMGWNPKLTDTVDSLGRTK